MVLQQIFLSLPGGFILGVVAPLNFAKLDNLVASDSAGKLEDLNCFLLFAQKTDPKSDALIGMFPGFGQSD